MITVTHWRLLSDRRDGEVDRRLVGVDKVGLNSALVNASDDVFLFFGAEPLLERTRVHLSLLLLFGKLIQLNLQEQLLLVFLPPQMRQPLLRGRLGLVL